MKVDPATAPRDVADNGGAIVYLSKAGGITQFGAYVDVLMPGAASSDRHWHTAEDEFAYILSGTATLIDNDGEHLLDEGDAVCWPHGCPNAHHLANDSTAPCSYLIVGTRVAGDICHYPDDGSRQINSATRWQVVNADGHTLREGDLPAELLGLPSVWGRAFDPANSGRRVLRVADQTRVNAPDTPHPIIGAGAGPYAYQLLSDPGGLTQFGAFIEELPPGSRSGHRHWHEAEDEMVYVLSGTGILVEDRETAIRPGDVLCWPKGAATGHRIDNRGEHSLRYLVIGTRRDDDVIHYPDHDLVTTKTGTLRNYARTNGQPIGERSMP